MATQRPRLPNLERGTRKPPIPARRKPRRLKAALGTISRSLRPSQMRHKPKAERGTRNPLTPADRRRRNPKAGRETNNRWAWPIQMRCKLKPERETRNPLTPADRTDADSKRRWKQAVDQFDRVKCATDPVRGGKPAIHERPRRRRDAEPGGHYQHAIDQCWRRSRQVVSPSFVRICDRAGPAALRCHAPCRSLMPWARSRKYIGPGASHFVQDHPAVSCGSAVGNLHWMEHDNLWDLGYFITLRKRKSK